MKYKYLIFSIFFMQPILLLAQVGINNPTPNATLDIIGAVKVQEKLYLENPGTYNLNVDSKLLMVKDADITVIRYDVDGSAFAPINYVRYAFMETSTHGLDEGYNTKISATKYTIAVHGFYFDYRGYPDVYLYSSTSGNYIEGHQFYAYIKDDTWWLKALVNNSVFFFGSTGSRVDIYMDLIIYRNNFITKTWGTTPITVDMTTSATKTADLPSGF